MRRYAEQHFEDYCIRVKNFVPGESITEVRISFPGPRKTLSFFVHPHHTSNLNEALTWIWNYAIFLSDLHDIPVPMSQWSWRIQPWRKLTSWEKKN